MSKSNNRFLPLLLEENTCLLEVENSQNASASAHPKNKDNKKKKKQQQASGSAHQHQKQAAPAQNPLVYVPMYAGVYNGTEVVDTERSVFLCISTNHFTEQFGCDWYRIDLVKKESRKVFRRLQWGVDFVYCSGAAAIGSFLYILGGLYKESGPSRSLPDHKICNDVFYVDVHRPGDGWKVGPRLPSPHFRPIAASMNGTVYVFNGKYVLAQALDTSASKPGWKPLRESPFQRELPSHLHFEMAFPDPVRDRIILFSHEVGFFAYYPHKERLVCIDPQFHFHMKYKRLITTAAVVDGVLYHHAMSCSYDGLLLSAYDLDQRKKLTPVFSYEFEEKVDPDWEWDQLLDLGGGKLCLVKYLQIGGGEGKVLFLKLKVRKQAGGDKAYIAAISFDVFRMLEHSRFEISVAL